MPGMARVGRALSLRAHFGTDRHPDALATLFWALTLGDPMTGGVEPDGTGGYGRAAVANDVALWGTVASDTVVISNQAEIVWPSATGAWSITDPLDHWAIFSASSGGTLWYAGKLEQPVTVAGAGDQPRILIGGLKLAQAG